jgi:GT2 family glycosyltransferase
MQNKSITIVVPIYGDWPSLRDCIKSLSVNVSNKVNKIFLVNDCGPEADRIEKNIKKLIKSKPKFVYHRNTKNLGFVKNCNNAVQKLDKTDNDILLLNSDTVVTKGFAEEMQKVLYSKSNIGVVSPRSNNATICTIPLSAIHSKGINMDDSYKIYLENYNKFKAYNIAPTAHGFCILIRRELIKKYGLFDEIFGKGYGEEVDFCQRIKKHGWLSVISNKSYVFHLEARSFSLEKKAELIKDSSKIIKKRYSGYRQEVIDYIDKNTKIESKIICNKNYPKLTNRLINKFKRILKRTGQ